MTSDRGNAEGAELQLDTPVTPKSPGLNPNATVFSCKSSSTGSTGTPDTGQWDHQDSGVGLNLSSSDYGYANGDVSSDKSDGGVFSPTSDSPFQQELSPFSTDNQAIYNSDNNANVAAKLSDTVGRQLLDNQAVYSTESGINSTPHQYNNSDLTFSSDNSATVSDGEAPTVDGSLSDEQLRQVLKRQLEICFSRESLASDPYLQSQMDADQYVSIATVASLRQIQKISSDIQLIVELLRESAHVQVDEKGEKVRPNHNRCIVILREIPESTPVQDVEDLFSGQNCPKFVSCKHEGNSNWYVTFDSDSSAQLAYQYLREEVKTFQGRPILARIKAKPLIRTTYAPRNGYIKRYQQQQGGQQPSPQQQAEQTTVNSTQQQQQQFPITQQFTLMPNVSQYMNGQQPIPFYPPNPMMSAWPTASNHTMLEPSMVLAMNGYQATNVKLNNVQNRNTFQNRNRNPKLQNNRQSERLGSDSRMSHDRPASSGSIGSSHKISPRNSDNMQISNVPLYHSRRMDGPMGHGGTRGEHSHMMHAHSTSSSSSQQHHASGVDNNSNHLIARSSSSEPLTQKRSYKSRRRREEDGARPTRQNSSQSSLRDHRHSVDQHFDYEPMSFPPLPGSGNNASSNEVFESKLSDVVRGTAKPQVRDMPKPANTAASSTPPTSTVVTSSTATTQAVVSPTSKDNANNNSSSSRASPPPSQPQTSSPSQPVVTATPVTRTPSVSSAQPVSPIQRSNSKPVTATPVEQKSIEVTKSSVSSKPATTQSQSQSQLQSKSQPKLLQEVPPVKLSYAQMVQKGKENDGSGDNADGAENDACDEESETDPALQTSNKSNHLLKEQSQSHPLKSTMSANTRAPGKDSYNYNKDSEPREQRFSNSRRYKENRENRDRDRDRDPRDRERDRDRRGRRDMREREREREGPRSSVSK